MRHTRSLATGKVPASDSSTDDLLYATKRTVLVKNVVTQKPSLKSVHTSPPTLGKANFPSKGTGNQTPQVKIISSALSKSNALMHRSSHLHDKPPTPKTPITFRHSMLASPDVFLEGNSATKQPSEDLAFSTNSNERKSATKIMGDAYNRRFSSNPIEAREKGKSAGNIDSVRPNVQKGGLELENRNGKPGLTSVSNRGDCLPPSLLQRRLSEKILAHRSKFLKDCEADHCVGSSDVLGRQGNFQHPLVEDGKKVLQKTRRVTIDSLKSGATKKLLEKLNQPMVMKSMSTHRSTNVTLDKNPTKVTRKEPLTSSSGIIQVKSSEKSIRSNSKILETKDDDVISKTLEQKYVKTCVPSDLSRIQLTAATIKDVMDDPLVIKEDGILSQIANPRNDITKKTLAKLLGENEQASMHTLKQKIIKKANKSQSLVPSGTSLNSGLTESESYTFSELDNAPSDDVTVDPNSVDTKSEHREKKHSKKKKRKKTRRKGVPPFCIFESSQNLTIDSQLQECLKRQEALEGQVSNFIEKIRAKSSTVPLSHSNETLDTLESLVKTQKEIINIQIDLRKRYGVGVSSPSLQQSPSYLHGRNNLQTSGGSEPILNPYNLPYGQLASFAKEINGKIAFYCPTCEVVCDNEMKFRLHLESASHVSKAYKALQDSQPLYNCDDCKTKIQGTTQFLAHVAGKNHLRNAKSNISLAMSVLESKSSLPKTNAKVFNMRQ